MREKILTALYDTMIGAAMIAAIAIAATALVSVPLVILAQVGKAICK